MNLDTIIQMMYFVIVVARLSFLVDEWAEKKFNFIGEE